MHEFVVYRHGWDAVNQNAGRGLPGKMAVARIQASDSTEACRLAKDRIPLSPGQTLSAEPVEEIDTKEMDLNRKAEAIENLGERTMSGANTGKGGKVAHPAEGGELSRGQVDRMPGAVLLEFGATWCGYCQAIRATMTALLRQYPQFRYFRVEDGRGKPLGRSFRVKLWPTLVFLYDGVIVQQMSRPSPDEIRAGFEVLAARASVSAAVAMQPVPHQDS